MSDPRTPAERALQRGIEDAAGRPLTRRQRQTQRSLEAYLRGEMRPRWMERIMQIDSATRRLERELAAAHRALRAQCGRDAGEFARRWHDIVATTDLEPINELIRQHNEWYPVERDLPIHPRTGRYLQDFERSELDAAWVLERFPA